MYTAAMGIPGKFRSIPMWCSIPFRFCRSRSSGITRYFLSIPPHFVDDTLETCYHNVSRFSDKTVFYGCDGARLAPEAFQPMEQYGHYDCMIMDAIFGDDPMKYRVQGSHIYFYHNSLSM